jgi:hypothetical protein
MNDLFTLGSDAHGSEPLDEGGTWLLDLVSAVDHLRRGYRPGFTVWDALAEAIEWAAPTTAEDGQRPGDFYGVLVARPASHEAVQRAVRVWVLVMADRYNNHHHWPHPESRRLFPPPLLADDTPDTETESAGAAQVRFDSCGHLESQGPLPRVTNGCRYG